MGTSTAHSSQSAPRPATVSSLGDFSLNNILYGNIGKRGRAKASHKPGITTSITNSDKSPQPPASAKPQAELISTTTTALQGATPQQESTVSDTRLPSTGLIPLEGVRPEDMYRSPSASTQRLDTNNYHLVKNVLPSAKGNKRLKIEHELSSLEHYSSLPRDIAAANSAAATAQAAPLTEPHRVFYGQYQDPYNKGEKILHFPRYYCPPDRTIAREAVVLSGTFTEDAVSSSSASDNMSPSAREYSTSASEYSTSASEYSTSPSEYSTSPSEYSSSSSESTPDPDIYTPISSSSNTSQTVPHEDKTENVTSPLETQHRARSGSVSSNTESEYIEIDYCSDEENGTAADSSNCQSEKKKRKKRRVLFSKHQTAQLEKLFLMHKYLSAKDRDRIAEELKMDPGQVKIWFQNHRYKLKKEIKECKEKGIPHINDFNHPIYAYHAALAKFRPEFTDLPLDRQSEIMSRVTSGADARQQLSDYARVPPAGYPRQPMPAVGAFPPQSQYPNDYYMGQLLMPYYQPPQLPGVAVAAVSHPVLTGRGARVAPYSPIHLQESLYPALGRRQAPYGVNHLFNPMNLHSNFPM